MTFRHAENPRDVLESPTNPVNPFDSQSLISDGMRSGLLNGKVSSDNAILPKMEIAMQTTNRPVQVGDPKTRTQADIDFEKETGSDRNSSK